MVLHLLLAVSLLLSTLPGAYAELQLNSAGAAYAPLEPKKGEASSGPLSEEDRQDLLKEFKGLVALGLRPQAYQHWEGRSMADCSVPERAEERWNYRCEIITAQCNGFYYFYPNESRHLSTLQQVEVKVHTTEPRMVDDLKASLRSLFGRESVIDPRMAGVPARGPVRHWNTGRDVVDLFMDVSENPAGLVRFVWKRSPLVAGASAKAENF